MRLFAGMRTIRIEVSSQAPTHHLDSVALQSAVIRQMNAARKRRPLLAVASGDTDCTLTLTVVREEEYQTLFPDPRTARADSDADAQWWQFHAVMLAELTDKDKRLLWADHSRSVWWRMPVLEEERTGGHGGWDDSEFRARFFANGFFSGVASGLVHELLEK
jgi:hypothetical protein